jgi:hypothetical protein
MVEEEDVDLDRLGVDVVLPLIEGGTRSASRWMGKWAAGEDGRCGCEYIASVSMGDEYGVRMGDERVLEDDEDIEF